MVSLRVTGGAAVVLLALVPGLSGCAASVTGAAGSPSGPRAGVPSGAPRTSGPTPVVAVAPLRLPPFVVTTLAEPLRSDANGRPVASLRRGLPMVVREVAPDGSSVLVATTGAVEVVGTLPLSGLSAVVCKPGLSGEHLYLGAGHQVALAGGLENGRIATKGVLSVRSDGPADDPKILTTRLAVVPYELTLPEGDLCTAPPKPRHKGGTEDPFPAHLAGETDLEDMPAGTGQQVLPKGTPLVLWPTAASAAQRAGARPILDLGPQRWDRRLPVLERQRDAVRVALGDGPFVVGWLTEAGTTKVDEEADAKGGLLMGGTLDHGPGSYLLYTRELQGLPLLALKAGATLRGGGVVHARFLKDGYARVHKRDGHQVFVTAAASDDLTVTGWCIDGWMPPTTSTSP